MRACMREYSLRQRKGALAKTFSVERSTIVSQLTLSIPCRAGGACTSEGASGPSSLFTWGSVALSFQKKRHRTYYLS
jgi:hypothetical protein